MMSDKEILKARGWQFNEDGLIDRKALLKRLEDFVKWCGDSRKSGTEFCIDVIKDMPSAQPESSTIWHNTYEEGFSPEGEPVLVTDETFFCIDESVANDVGLQWSDSFDQWEKTKWAYLNDLLKVQPEPKWILNTLNNIPKDPIRKQIQLTNGWIITGYFDGEYWYAVPDFDGALEFFSVKAWRELPEPYEPKGANDGKNG